MLSAALSRTQLFPPFVVLSKTPLPPAAHASSCSCMHRIPDRKRINITVALFRLIDWLAANCNCSCLVLTNVLPASDSRRQEFQTPGSALAPPGSLQLSTHETNYCNVSSKIISKEQKTTTQVSILVSSQGMLIEGYSAGGVKIQRNGKSQSSKHDSHPSSFAEEESTTAHQQPKPTICSPPHVLNPPCHRPVMWLPKWLHMYADV